MEARRVDSDALLFPIVIYTIDPLQLARKQLAAKVQSKKTKRLTKQHTSIEIAEFKHPYSNEQ
jgi:hypothetical protein